MPLSHQDPTIHNINVHGNTEELKKYRRALELNGAIWKTELPVQDHTPSALDVQVAGSHYKDLKIQPIEYIHANNIPFCEASVVKYVTRWRSKGGIKDLEKARHFIDLLIELESKNAG